MFYKLLEWDSQFFGLNVASLTLSTDDGSEDVQAFLQKKKDYDLCYVFCPPYDDGRWVGLSSIGGTIVDYKVSLEKRIIAEPAISQSKNIMEMKTISLDAEELAIRSGWKSRFKKDNRLASMQPELYRRWFVKDLESPNAKVFGFFSPLGLMGIACASVEHEKRQGKLDLISVGSAYVGLGIGGKLMQAVEQYWKHENCVYGSIVTQQDNNVAMLFYKKNGYTILSIQEVWHVWR